MSLSLLINKYSDGCNIKCEHVIIEKFINNLEK